MTPLDVLKGARQLIASPTRWTTGAYARNKEGYEVGVYDVVACKWCAVGAIYKAASVFDQLVPPACRLLIGIDCDDPRQEVINMNDDVCWGHAAVLRQFDMVIDKLEVTRDR